MAEDNVKSLNEENLIKEIGIGLSVKGALKLYRLKIIALVFLLVLFVSLLSIPWVKGVHVNEALLFIENYILIPSIVYILVQLICLLFGVYAWSRTSLRLDQSLDR